MSFFFVSGNASAEETQWISLCELHSRMNAGEKMMLLSPQTDIIFNEGHIPGSTNIPLSQIVNTDKLPRDKDVLIVIYCQEPKCTVSEKAAALIAGRGYRNIRSLKDGANAWAVAGYPLEYKDALPRVPVSSVNASQLRGRLQEVVVLDIRPPALYEMGWIKGSQNMPIDDLSERYVVLPKGRQIVVVDHTGNQVILAARFLEQKGYEVLGLQGGMRSWVSEGFPVEK